eukprot:PhM_4_TR8912/c0_g1_i1/m.6123/K20823/NAA35, MAK10; N-alpha-acetyltransferase 35, NatC auxiliary subunit
MTNKGKKTAAKEEKGAAAAAAPAAAAPAATNNTTKKSEAPATVWKDRLAELKDAVKSMEPGSVINAPEVRLQDVISAVEMLDPRTDFNCEFSKVKTLDDLVKGKEVASEDEVAKFSADDVQGIMERLMQLEHQWLEGRPLPQTLFSCVYLHDLKRIEKKAPILYAYLRGVLKFVTYTLEAIMRAEVREEDEFPTYTFNLELRADDSVEDVLACLEAARADAEKKGWTKVAALLQYRAQLLNVSAMLDAGVSKLAKGAETDLPAALSALDTVASNVVATPTANVARVFHDVTSRWVSALTPLSPVTTLPIAEAVAYFRKMLEDMKEMCTLVPTHAGDLAELMSFVMDFSARTPSLVVRSWLMVLAYNGETQVLFEKGTIMDLLVSMFTTTYGCPTFEQILKGDATTIKAVASFRAQKLRDLKKYCQDFAIPDSSDLSKLGALTQQQVADFMSRLGKVLLHVLFSVLNNRARYRRRLANLISEFGNLQKMAWEIDTNIFGGGISCLEHYFTQDPRAAETCEQCLAAQQAVVLSAFVMDVVVKCMLDYILVGMELELYATEELPYAYSYAEYIVSVMHENFSVLYKLRDFVTRNAKKTQRLFPPIVNARKVCLPSTSTQQRLELLRLELSGRVRLHNVLTRAQLLPSTGTRSLNTLRVKYEHRWGVFEELMRPTPFKFEAYERHAESLQHGDLGHLVESTVQVFDRLASRHDEFKATLSPSTAALCQRWQSVAKANLVCARLVKSLLTAGKADDYCAASEFTATLPVYKLSRKQKK